MKEFSTQKNECPYFNKCSGCDVESIYQPPIWDEINDYFNNKGIKEKPNLFTSDFKSSRLKAKLAIQKDKKNILIGLYKKGSHEVLDIPKCYVHHDVINKAAKLIKKNILKHNISIYSEKSQKGFIRYLQFFVQRNTEKVQVVIVLNEKDDVCLKKYKLFFDDICLHNDIFHSIWLNFNDKVTNVIFTDKWKPLYGEEDFWQKIYKFDFHFHPRSFAQANICLFEKLIKNVDKEVSKGEKFKHALELYAGNGSIGINLAHNFDKMTLVEINPYSFTSFNKNIKKHSIENIKYLNEDVENVEMDFNDYDIIIADPPRKGLGINILQRLAQKNKGLLIYISCYFNSFKKDCDFLLNNSWKIRKADGFLFFPGTNHVEVLAFFEKNLGERI